MFPSIHSTGLAEAILRSQAWNTSEKATATARTPLTVAISREVGALGNTVAQAVSRRLGWQVHDRELLEKVAAEMRCPAHDVSLVDERPRNWFEEALSGLFIG